MELSSWNNVLYRGKEKIYSEIELNIYQLKWYSPTSIISLALLVLRPKLVLLLTNILSELSLCFCFLLLLLLQLKRHESHVLRATVQHYVYDIHRYHHTEHPYS